MHRSFLLDFSFSFGPRLVLEASGHLVKTLRAAGVSNRSGVAGAHDWSRQSVIQSEVSQNEKKKYRMLTHIYRI